MLVYLLSAIETDEDRALFVDLFEKYHDRMEQAALRIVKNSHDAEDAVQNAYLQIIRHLDKVSEIPCKNRGFWCISIVKKEALNILRKNKRIVLSEELEEKPIAATEETLSYKEIVQLFAELPEIYRAVLEMRLILGYSGKEIADRMGITENAVNVRINRGRALLRKIAEKEGIYP